MNTSVRRPFPTTRWSLVREVANSDPVAARQALAALCEIYWPPVYTFIRRSGKGPQDAEDLTQNFFQRLIEKEIFASADPTKGNLRAFLRTHVTNFLRDEVKSAMAQKRGNGMIVALRGDGAEERYLQDAGTNLPPDQMFQRRWSLTMLENTLHRLKEEAEQANDLHTLEALRPWLGFTAEKLRPYREIADELGISETALKSKVSRLRKRFKAILFAEVAQTLDDPSDEDIRDELKELRSFL